MDLISLIVTIALVGLLAWAITTIIPMPDIFRRAINVVCVVVVILYVCNALGIIHGIPHIRITR
jgi:VIT1/CCC1 family predicted Fe2+/Mn2+ transporter